MKSNAVRYLKDGEQTTSFVKNMVLSDGKAEKFFLKLSQVIYECGSINKMAAFVNDGEAQ